MGSLDLYRAKRDFQKTSEPAGRKTRTRRAAGGVFVVHKHAARRLHYDLRLEHDGVLWSWAVTRGPSLDPDDKRLAVHVEDHPLDYGGFEGNIPAGQYGAGAVIVWDEGRWEPEGDPARAMAKGHITFTLEGHKLRGGWHLVRLRPRRGDKKDNWLLIKRKDEAASEVDILAAEPASVLSGRTIEEVAKGRPAPAAAKARKAGPSAGAAPRRAKAEAALPDFVAPCLATLKAVPASGERWVHEVKFDGYRIQARIDHGKVRLMTRSGLDWTSRFGAGLSAALAALPCETALIDGEIVMMSDGGISSFAALQAALSERRPDGFVYFAFDLLHLDGEDLRADPLLSRKERLAHLLEGPKPESLRYSEHFAEPGEVMLDHACRMGLEGVISKRADAPYMSGRSGDWVKSKCIQSQEFVVVGYVPSNAAGRSLRSLVLGYHEDGRLVPAGRVGTGFTARSAAALRKRLDAVKAPRSAFEGAPGREKGVVWLEPSLVAEIEYRTWTADGRLRQASFKGLREDKPAGEVVRERPRDAPARAAGAGAPGRPAEAPATSVTLTNPDKVLWPDAGLTKAGLLAHYAGVWERMATFVLGRPLSLLRAPDGIQGQSFFQKNASRGMHAAIRRKKDPGSDNELLFIEDFDGLAALVQLGVVEVHVWGATVARLEQPDQIIFDLDPGDGVGPAEVRAAAAEVRGRLADLGFESFLKASGGKGFHVAVPLEPAADWAAVKGFAHDFARAMAEADPKRYTATLAKKARKGRIFVDYLRNGRGATAIAPYSPRARAGAPVAMPVAWAALEDGLAPNAFSVGDALPTPDPWQDFVKRAKPLRRRG